VAHTFFEYGNGSKGKNECADHGKSLNQSILLTFATAELINPCPKYPRATPPAKHKNIPIVILLIKTSI
jgi:hypothetical protein